MKIVFFGTDNFAAHVLDVLRQSHEVVAVVTVPDAPVGRKQILQETAVSALAAGLGIRTLKPVKLKDDAELESVLRDCNADIFVVAIYSKIIPQNILSLPSKGNINVHPSLLPLYRGPAPIRTPLLNGDTKTGVSIMLMDEQVDHGPLLASEEMDIELVDTNVSLTDKLAKVAAPLLVQAITGYETGAIMPQPQDHTKATFTKLVSKEDGRIDWSKSAQEIYNMWRAYQPWPGIYTTWNGKLLKIIECKPVPSGFSPFQGEIERGEFQVSTSPSLSLERRGTGPGIVLSGGVIACGSNTYLQTLTLQPEGKQPMDIKSFLNGNKDFIGSSLNS